MSRVGGSRASGSRAPAGHELSAAAEWRLIALLLARPRSGRSQLRSQTFWSWACASATTLRLQHFVESLVADCGERPANHRYPVRAPVKFSPSPPVKFFPC